MLVPSMNAQNTVRFGVIGQSSGSGAGVAGSGSSLFLLSLGSPWANYLTSLRLVS